MGAVLRSPVTSYDRGMVTTPALALFPSLADLTAEGRRLFETTVSRIARPAGTPLIARGDLVTGAYLVESGALRVYYVSAEGREGTLYWVEPGQSCILALNALFSRLAYPAWVEAEGDTSVTIVPGDVYRRLFATEPAVQAFTFEVLSGRLFELMALIEETASQGLEARLAAFLVRRAKGGTDVAVTQEQIARHLATSREVVSRLVRGLVARRLVATTPRRVTLLDPTALAALVE
jgi:CRP/FNR family transcriptional regulator